MTNTNIFKVYGDDKLAYETFTSEQEAITWAMDNSKTFSLVELELKNGVIALYLNNTDWGIRVMKGDNGEHRLMNGQHLMKTFEPKERRALVLHFIETAMQYEKENAEAEEQMLEDAQGAYAFYHGISTNEGPYGGAFADEYDYARHVGIDLKD